MRPGQSSSSVNVNLIGADSEMDKMEYGMLEPQTKVELFDVLSGDEDDEEEEIEMELDGRPGGIGGGMILGGSMIVGGPVRKEVEVEDEFTLGMDMHEPGDEESLTSTVANPRKRRECEPDGWVSAKM